MTYPIGSSHKRLHECTVQTRAHMAPFAQKTIETFGRDLATKTWSFPKLVQPVSFVSNIVKTSRKSVYVYRFGEKNVCMLSMKNQELSRREIYYLAQLRECPHVVKLITAARDEKQKFKALIELGVPLLDILESNDYVVNPIALMHDLLKGLANIHQFGIFHRDLKPENIILVQDQQLNITFKFIDFEMAELANQEHNPNVGTPSSLPPEHCKMTLSAEQNFQDVINEKNEAWQLGLIFLIVILKKMPPWFNKNYGGNWGSLYAHFVQYNVLEIIQIISVLKEGWLPPLPQEGYCEIAAQMLCIDPKRRLSPQEAWEKFQLAYPNLCRARVH